MWDGVGEWDGVMGGLIWVYNRIRGFENVGGDIENILLVVFYNNFFVSYDLYKLIIYLDIFIIFCL